MFELSGEGKRGEREGGREGIGREGRTDGGNYHCNRQNHLIAGISHGSIGREISSIKMFCTLVYRT